jgi:bifunctional ADP-heptose synthase (sugar kinase/adenylyltransferase)
MVEEFEMNVEALKEIIEQFDGARVLVIGDFMWDTFIQGVVSRISPEAPVPVINVAYEIFRPGGAANAISRFEKTREDTLNYWREYYKKTFL